jgi:filamentous hemagglutinin
LSATRARIEANIAETRSGINSSKFDEFISSEGKVHEQLDVWPPNMGRIGAVEIIDLQPGFVMDRFGLPNGRFLSPQGVPFTNRALPSGYESSKPYFLYEVVKPIPGVTKSRALPWFGQKGMGDQLELPRGVNYLDPKNGYVKVRHREQ